MLKGNVKKIYDVFQPGLRRGAERLAFAPHKQYFYVEHPLEGWRVYLRSCAFIHDNSKPFSAKDFLVVKRKGAHYSTATWEPPKGQMEWKDTPGGKGSLVQLLAENIEREMFEEAYIKNTVSLKHTGLVFQGQESNYPDNHYFQYHIFQGFITPKEIDNIFSYYDWLKEHPKAFARMRKDRQEKDAIDWFSPRRTPINPRWCPSIVSLYLKEYS